MQHFILFSTAVIILSFLSNGLNGQPYRGQQQNFDFQKPMPQDLPPNQDGFPVVRPEWQAAWPNPRQMEDLKNAIVLALLELVYREVHPGFPPQVEHFIAIHSSEFDFETANAPEGGEPPQESNYGGPSAYGEVPGGGPRPPSSIYGGGTYSDHGSEMSGEYYPQAENEDHSYIPVIRPPDSFQNPPTVIEPDEYTADKLEKRETDGNNSMGPPTVNTVFLIATVLQSAWFVHKAIFE